MAYQKFGDILKAQAVATDPETLGALAALGGVYAYSPISPAEPPGSHSPISENTPIDIINIFPSIEKVSARTHVDPYPPPKVPKPPKVETVQNWANGADHLDPEKPPAGITERRWRALLYDIAKFLASDFAPTAAALGWSAHDLFGCDDIKPVERIDKAGLLWLLNGHRLVALTASTAVIETRTGARQTYRRKSGELSRVPVWALVR